MELSVRIKKSSLVGHERTLGAGVLLTFQFKHVSGLCKLQTRQENLFRSMELLVLSNSAPRFDEIRTELALVQLLFDTHI